MSPVRSVEQVSHERLLELFSYDPATGNLIRLKATGSRGLVGMIAGPKISGKDGYKRIAIDGIDYLQHRIIWFYVHGAWPEEQIDHISGVRHDNRLENLREVTQAQNSMNMKRRSTATNKYSGVFFDRKHRKWHVSFRNKRIATYLNSEEEGRQIYLAALAEYNASFATPCHPDYGVICR